MKKARIWISILILSVILFACKQSDSVTSDSMESEFAQQAGSQDNFIDEQSTNESSESFLEQSSETIDNNTDTQQFIPLSSEFIFSTQDTNIESYSGQPYIEINNNVPYFSEADLTTESFELYSDLDEYGRCGTAYANICTDSCQQKNEEK